MPAVGPSDDSKWKLGDWETRLYGLSIKHRTYAGPMREGLSDQDISTLLRLLLAKPERQRETLVSKLSRDTALGVMRHMLRQAAESAPPAQRIVCRPPAGTCASSPDIKAVSLKAAPAANRNTGTTRRGCSAQLYRNTSSRLEVIQEMIEY